MKSKEPNYMSQDNGLITPGWWWTQREDDTTSLSHGVLRQEPSFWPQSLAWQTVITVLCRFQIIGICRSWVMPVIRLVEQLTKRVLFGGRGIMYVPWHVLLEKIILNAFPHG